MEKGVLLKVRKFPACYVTIFYHIPQSTFPNGVGSIFTSLTRVTKRSKAWLAWDVGHSKPRRCGEVVEIDPSSVMNFDGSRLSKRIPVRVFQSKKSHRYGYKNSPDPNKARLSGLLVARSWRSWYSASRCVTGPLSASLLLASHPYARLYRVLSKSFTACWRISWSFNETAYQSILTSSRRTPRLPGLSRSLP